MNAYLQNIARNIRQFNACEMHKAVRLELFFSFKTSEYILKDHAKGLGQDVVKRSRSFAAISEAAELFCDRPIRLAA